MPFSYSYSLISRHTHLASMYNDVKAISVRHLRKKKKYNYCLINNDVKESKQMIVSPIILLYLTERKKKIAKRVKDSLMVISLLLIRQSRMDYKARVKVPTRLKKRGIRIRGSTHTRQIYRGS